MNIVYVHYGDIGEIAVFLCDGKKLSFQGVYENLAAFYVLWKEKNVKKNWNITPKLSLEQWIQLKIGQVLNPIFGQVA